MPEVRLGALAVAGVWLLALAACRSAPQSQPPPRVVEVPAPKAPLEELVGPCWPEDTPDGAEVVLTLFGDDGRVKDIVFEARNGATNSVGRCARQVAWEFPWTAPLPQSVSLTKPQRMPDGWTVLEHIRLLSSQQFGPERGLIDPIPLVAACLEQGDRLRPDLEFRALTQPVRVFPMAAGIGAARRPSEPITDAERCVQAVLASTVYPGSRSYAFDFGRGTSPQPAAPVSRVAHYFVAAGQQEATGELDLAQAKAALGGVQPAVAQCWERALMRRGGLSGARTFRIRVLSSGHVESVQVVADRSTVKEEAADYLLDQCVAAAVLEAKIPPPEGGPGEFAYTWVFALRQ